LRVHIRTYVGKAETPNRVLLGCCTLPIKMPNAPELNWDGCMVLHSTVSAGGKTMTYEFGHWFGLLYLFDGGCTGGDGMEDTPAERTPSEGCELKRNTCLDQPGYDSV
jgi:hypothetical protein